MGSPKKSLKDCKYGLNGSKKKIGVNSWRFFFNGIEKTTGVENMFFIELELNNPWLNPVEPVLGFTPRVKITEEDLQYALAGTASAKELKAESIVQPSFVVIRVGRLGRNAKQICAYYGAKEVKFMNKPFTVQADNKVFTEDALSGFINLSEEECNAHPEYLCEAGYATWNLKYDVVKDFIEGYDNNGARWFPYGIRTNFAGQINFDGTDYVVEPRKCLGYCDRYWGKSLPKTWFHISSADLTSNISGKTLFNSNFSIQGEFEDRLSFVGNFEGADILYCADDSKRLYTAVWNCVQSPESEDEEENKLHWSVSINSKTWVIDIDLYCKIKDLYNRNLELPDGERKIMNVVQGAAGVGEIKLFKHVKNSLEQIEYATIAKAVCEYGHTEEGEI